MDIIDDKTHWGDEIWWHKNASLYYLCPFIRNDYKGLRRVGRELAAFERRQNDKRTTITVP